MGSLKIMRDQAYLLKNSLIDELSGLLEYYREENGGKVSEELESLLQKAAQQLDTPYRPQTTVGLQWFDVPAVGRPAGQSQEELQESGVSTVLASAFAGQGKPFAIRCSFGDSPAFSVASGTAKETQAVVRSACQYAQLRPSNYVQPDSSVYRAKAGGTLFFMDSGSSEQKLNREKTENWVDRVSAAMPGEEYAVSFQFDPVEQKWLENQLREANRLRGWLEAYSEMSWQVSGNVGNGIMTTGSVFMEGKKMLEGTDRDSPSYGMSASLSRTLRRSDAKLIAEQLQYHCIRLSQMLRGGAYAVSVSVSAQRADCLAALQSVLSGSLARNGISLRWSTVDVPPLLLPAHSLDLLVCVPEREFPGFSILETEEYDLNHAESSDGGIPAGSLMWNETILRRTFTIPYCELNRHAFICGMTGAGKSNTVCHLLSCVDRPFIVIEPVKGEYRSLCGALKRETRVYTMNVSGDEMLQVNPLWFPLGASLQYHIDSIKTIIASAFDLYAAMPNILEQCLLRTYIKAGWNLITNRNIYEGKLPDDWLYPTISDLCAEIERYLDDSDFEGETKGNYKGALLSRLQSFTSGAKGILLNEPAHISFDEWLEKGVNVVIELDALADDADKCIVMGTILTQYFQYVKYCTVSGAGDGLKHLMVLEEAHHLFAEDSSSEDGSSARKQLVSALSNLLAEIRAYGEGVLIVDQSPTRISTEVIKNTAVKLVHRVDYGKDIEILRDALLLREGDRTIARLGQGQALVRCGTMARSAMIQVPCCETKERFAMEKHPGAAVNSHCLVQSVMNTVLLDDILRMELTKACGLFVNQALFDELPGIRKAFRLLWEQTQRLLYQHGLQELVRSSGQEQLLGRLIPHGLKLSAAEYFPAYICAVVRIYLERLFVLESGGLLEKEWLLLKDYRTVQIHARLIELYSSRQEEQYIRLRTACGQSKFLGILAQLIPLLSGLPACIGSSDTLTPEQEGQARTLIAEKLRYCFYIEPDSDVTKLLGSMLIHYFVKTAERS